VAEAADAVIVGGGAAGLAAARIFSRHGVRTVLLEARDRLGGRIDTRTVPNLPVPLEMGAEFVHGTAAITFELLREGGSTTIDTAISHWEYIDDDLRQLGDAFEVAERLVSLAHDLREDISVEQFLLRCKQSGADDDSIRWFRWLVEGFDAADPARAGVLEIAEEWSGPELEGRQSRPFGGYAPLLRALGASLDPKHVDIRLDSFVEGIAWKRGTVRVSGRRHGEKFEIEGKRAIVTLPLGTLSDVRFSPALDARKKRALDMLAMGSVVKVALCFRRRWWEELHDGRYAEAAFFHRHDADFPTFWTQLPVRAPVVTAWAGGPRADALAGLNENKIVRRALRALEATFPERIDLEAELQAAFVADWAADPLARGAYSYVLVGGNGARDDLAASLDATLFFAGEATSTDYSGTVSGALASGVRAAQQALGAT
jgi:monoamine oxidase